MATSFAREGYAGGHGLRQRVIPKVLWHRADLDGGPAMVPADQRRMALHRTRKAHAERLCRELQRALQGRMPQ